MIVPNPTIYTRYSFASTSILHVQKVHVMHFIGLGPENHTPTTAYTFTFTYIIFTYAYLHIDVFINMYI